MGNVTIHDRILNADILARTHMDPIGLILARRRLTYLGHLVRLLDERLHKQVLFAHMGGIGNRGRHPPTLKEQYHADIQRLLGTYDGQSHTNLGTAWLPLACDADAWNLKVRSLTAVSGD